MTLAIILAGGLGTRLQSTVPDLPKPMAPINGRPFLEYQMDYWIAQGIDRFILSVGYRKEYIINHFGKAYQGCAIDYISEDTPLGTGGALLLAAEHVPQDNPVLVLNGDTFFEVNFKELKSFHVLKDSQWTFSLFRPNEKKRYAGIEINVDGTILSLKSETTDLSSLANGGVYLIDPRVLKKVGFLAGEKASLENDLLQNLIKQKVRLNGLEFDGRFIDIGVPQDYERASSLLAS